MKESNNLWMGLLVGGVLTGGLFWFLYQQEPPATVNSAGAVQEHGLNTPSASVDEPVAAGSTATLIPPASPEKPTLNPVPEAVNAEVVRSTTTKPAATLPPAGTARPEPEVAPVAKATAEAIGLPESLDLSAEQLAELSPEERARYDEMLASYREVRNKVLRLHQEREQLKRRMDKIHQQNVGVEQQLETLRKRLQAGKEGAVPNPNPN